MINNRYSIVFLGWLIALAGFAQEIEFERFPASQVQLTGTINCMIQDRQGFLWLGAVNGLFRYDGHDFKAFRHQPGDSASLSGNFIWSICEDRNGDLWIGTSGKGLNRFLREEERFLRYRHHPGDSTSIAGVEEVPWVLEDRSGNIWVALWENGLDLYHRDANRFRHYPFRFPDEEGTLRSSVHRIYRDRFGDFWVGSRRGLYKFDPSGNQIIPYPHDPGNPASPGGNYVYAICEDREGRLWIGTLDGGLSRYDRSKDAFINYRHNSLDPYSLSSDAVTALCIDSSGYLWVGMEDGGLNRCDPQVDRFFRFTAKPGVATGLSSNSIVSLLTDCTGILWVGTDDGTLHRYNPRQRKFTHIPSDPLQPGMLGSALVNAVWEGRDGTVWVGTAGGGLNPRFPGQQSFSRFRSEQLGSDFVTAICEDRASNLWIGTNGAGVCRYDPHSQGFRRYHFLPGNRGAAIGAKVNALLCDRRGNLWIGTDGDGIACYRIAQDTLLYFSGDPASGLYSLRHVFAIVEDAAGDLWFGIWGMGVARYQQSSGEVTLFNDHPETHRQLHGDVVISLAEDAAGNIWMGTWGEGLSVYHRAADILQHFTMAEGLSNNIVTGILPDRRGNIWISTANGLSLYHPHSRRWKNFDLRDGLQSNVFRTGAFHRGHSGRLYFGGVNGLNIIEPGSMPENRIPPPVVITGLSILNEPVTSRTAGSPLSRSISATETLHLSYKHKFFSLSFAALDYSAPEKNRYAYRMENFDEHWNEAGNAHTATYTNLDPGQYVFRVKASNSDGVWNEAGATLHIRIDPPPWKTWWAYSFYLLATVGALYLLRRYELSRLRLKHQLRVEQLDKEKLSELDHLKSRFFANISHELRTPLTLILAPIENALAHIASADIRSQLRLAHENGRRLQRLIDQLLDLSRLDAGAMQLHRGRVEMITFLKGIAFSFESLAQQKNITLLFHTACQRLVLEVDAEKLEQVFYNLITNALKFTPAGGQVSVKITVPASPERSNPAGGRWVQISVADTGTGIPAEDLPHIFERFYQGNNLHQGAQGAGIGLALAKEIVERHGGQISVFSHCGEAPNPRKGTCFVISLPLPELPVEEPEAPSAAHLPVRNVPDAIAALAEAPEVIKPGGGPDKKSAEVILLVEDNAELRAFLRTFLASQYTVVEAANGREGVQTATETVPDLVISDVMMPEMDGFAFCQALKGDPRTSHIPVILLTARAGEESKLAGLHTGADDYLTKPFNSRELRARVQNLIDQRRRLREKFSREILLKPGDISVSSLEEQFLNRVKRVVEEHLGDETFTVEALSREVGMSRVQLHRKLTALTGFSAGEFLLKMRLQRAEQLLRQNAATVSEVAYTVGFNTPNYFAKCFRKEFGCSPSEYRQRAGK